MKSPRSIPELLAPAGSLDAVRAAVANGANAVYLGAEKFNARDEGAQLTLDEVAQACAIMHARGGRVYLTLNTLVKPAELDDALNFLGEAIDRGVDAAIVQDIGLIRLIQAVYPDFEIHGSTQMTVHDPAGAQVMRDLGINRIVLARENTVDDIRAIHSAVPDLGLETFIHGALCISYSGQCYMSGMISERSANRGSCAQSCRKDYTLTDSDTGDTLDAGYLISAKDLAAHDHLAEIADAGVGCLKIEGRKKKPEYVATVTHAYRDFLDHLAAGDTRPPMPQDVQPLVQIYSRGFTPGMYVGRAGRSYITREQPDNRGIVLGAIVGHQGRDVVVEVSIPLAVGDGIAFEPMQHDEPTHREAGKRDGWKGDAGKGDSTIGGTVQAVHTLAKRGGMTKQVLSLRVSAPIGWRVVRTADGALLERSRASYVAVQTPHAAKLVLNINVFGSAGSPLKLVCTAAGNTITVQGDIPLVPATRRALDVSQLREQLGRLGETPFVLGLVDAQGLHDGLFIPVSELNRLRQSATDQLASMTDWDMQASLQERRDHVAQAIATLSVTPQSDASPAPFTLSAHVYTIDDARTAAAAGATEIVFDPFLRHPTPPLSRVRALAEELATRQVALRIRTPTIIRPEDRRALDKWLALDLPFMSGHLGLVAEFAKQGTDVIADYAVNCFNQHTAAELFQLGASRIVPSIELTTDELAQLVAPWQGRGFDVLVYGRPEGMTIEHCVLSAAFDRVVTTCRDLCVQKHTNVTLTDPAGYTFAVATDSACRNRLLHSRPIEASEYIPKLWNEGLRAYHAVFNVPGDDITAVVHGYREILDALAEDRRPSTNRVREYVGPAFTRGHFARAV